MTEKCKVVVSRRWKDEAQIEAFISNYEVGARMALKDFIIALAEEMSDVGAPKDVVKRSLQNACGRVLTEMKGTTKHVIV